MIRRLKGIQELFRREIRIVTKDINIMSVILLAPLFYSFFYGSVYINKVERDVPVVVVDMDRTNTTQKLIRMLDAHQMISVTETVPDYSTGIAEINNSDSQCMIFIPKGFEAELKSGKGGFIKIYLNTSRFLVSNDLNLAINEVLGYFNAGIKLKYFQTQGYTIEESKQLIEPVNTDLRPLFNYTESYGEFLIPGILVLVLQQTLLIGLSESMAKERENNTLGELYEKSNYSTLAMVNGKGLFYFILFSAYALLFYTINFALFKINFKGSIPAVIVMTFLLLFAVIYIAIFVSSFFKRKIVALQFLSFLSFPVFLMSGYSWPMHSMPLPLQWIANLIPSTPYLGAFIRITQMGAGFGDVLPEIFHLMIIASAAFALVYIRLDKLAAREKNLAEIKV